MLDPALTFIATAAAAGLAAWLLTFCLKNGVIGGGLNARDAHRDAQPIRYWIGVTALALVTGSLIAGSVYFALILVI